MATRKTATRASTKSTAKTETVKTPIYKGLKLRDLIIPLIIVVLAVAVWYFRSEFVVATVNGQPITRWTLVKTLEEKNGKATLQSIVTEELISQEAAKRNIDISPTDVNAEISKIEKSLSAQGQNIDLVLSQQGMSREDLDKQIKLQLMLKKMVGAVKVTAADVDKYIEDNKEAIPDDADLTTIKAQVKEQLEQQKISEKIQEFISNLQKKAKINYLKDY